MAKKNNQAALGAGATTDLGGRTLHLAPMTPGDWGRLRRHLYEMAQKEVASSTLAAIAEDLPLLSDQDREAAIRIAVSMAIGGKRAEPNREAILEKSNTHEGVCYQVWLAARRNHADVALEWVRKEVTDDNLDDLRAKIIEANEPADQEKAEDADPKA